MPGTCITCLSTQNLIVMGAHEWKAFDFILHPFSKEYHEIRTNQLARLCTRCQSSMRCIEGFRMFATKNFLQLMSVWNMRKSSPIATFATDDPLYLKSEPQPYYEDITPRKKQYHLIPNILNSSSVTVLSHTLKKVKEETQSDNEQEETVEIKTEEESEDHHDNVVEEIEVKEEEAVVDSEEAVVDSEEAVVDSEEAVVDSEEAVVDSEEAVVDSEEAVVDSEVFASLRKYGNLPPETCIVCKKTFCNKYSLQKHIKNMHNDEKIRVYCEVCDKWCNNRMAYDRHIKNSRKHCKKEDLDKHGNLPPETCTVCMKTFCNKYSLQTHIKNVHNDEKTRVVYCEVCDKWCNNRMAYNKHIKNSRKHYKKEDLDKHRNLPSEKCIVCMKTFSNKYSLQLHIKNMHNDDKIRVYCEVCDKWFNNRMAYGRHVKNSRYHYKKEDLDGLKVACKICNKIFTHEKYLKVHMKTHDKNKYCKPCDMWFTTNAYQSHLATTLKHTRKEDRRFTCDECGEKFVTKVLIRDHIQVIHQNLLPYKCPHCPEKFKNGTNKNRHVRAVHEKRPYPKNHICEVCGSAWQTATLLQKHLVVHTGARPYKCGKCDATFGHKSALYLHNRYKHEKKKCPPKKKKTGTKNTRNKKSTLESEPS